MEVITDLNIIYINHHAISCISEKNSLLEVVNLRKTYFHFDLTQMQVITLMESFYFNLLIF